MEQPADLLGKTGSSEAEKEQKRTTGAARGARKTAGVKKQYSADEASTAVHGLIEMVQVFTLARFGPAGLFTPEELALIEPSLARLVERYGSSAEQFAWLVDPLLLATGITMYGVRLSAVIRNQRPNDEPPADNPPPADEPPPPGANGVHKVDPFAVTGSIRNVR